MNKNLVFIPFFLLIFCVKIFSQWVIVSAPVSLGQYPVISAAGCSIVALGGGTTNNPVVYISTNSGSNFINITGNITGNEIYSLWALDADTIFAGDGGSPGGVGGNAKVYKTTNGGVNWTNILSTGGNNGFISGIVFSRQNPDFGIIVSDPPLINDSFWVAKTFNRGVNWVITRVPYTAQYITQHSAFVVDSLFYGFGLISSPGKFYLTTNGGLSWSVKFIGLGANSVNSISFKDDKLTGIALSDIAIPNIARTTNGGANWQTVNLGPGINIVSHVKWAPGTDVFFLASNKIIRSSNNGVTWSAMESQGVQNFTHFDLIESGINSICAYALASDGRVLKYEGEPFAVDPKNTAIPVQYLLKQNYPNPFNPSTILKYSLPAGGFVTMKIYDNSGRELMSMVNAYQPAGNYFEEADLSDYSSGIYYFQLRVMETPDSYNTLFSETRKMVLLK